MAELLLVLFKAFAWVFWWMGVMFLAVLWTVIRGLALVAVWVAPYVAVAVVLLAKGIWVLCVRAYRGIRAHRARKLSVQSSSLEVSP